MPAILVCASDATVRELQASPLWRDGFQKEIVATAAQAIALAPSLKPRLVVVDRDLAAAEFLVRQIRANAATRATSVVVVARGEQQLEELGLIDAGANGVLRLPPGPDWDVRVEPLLNVPTRKQTRLSVNLKFVAQMKPAHAPGRIVNLSATGMLIEVLATLPVGAEVRFSTELSGFETSSGEIKGIARVVRVAAPNLYGMSFASFEDGGGELLRRYLLIS
ncbi:MAG: PilZ domain-containing protein [Vicinamibacteria bacterium]